MSARRVKLMARRSRSFRLPRRWWQTVPVLVALVLVGALQQWRPELFRRTAEPPVAESIASDVERVVDGDTFILAGSEERVRLIGANTPETVKRDWPVEPWGPEASAFTKQFLAQRKVRLEFDGPRRDKYGRTLAFVWVGDRMLNEELIRAGLARAELQYPFSEEKKELLRRAEEEARANRRGIWSDPDTLGKPDR